MRVADACFIAFYLILTIIAFFPIVTKIDTAIIGGGDDAYGMLWNIWWIRKATTEGRNIFYTDYMYYPKGTYLYFSVLSMSNAFIASTLSFFISYIASYNILMLSTYVLSGCFMFLLVNYLVKDRRIALVAGVAYAFSPYHLSHTLGHLNLASIQWIPLYTLFLLKGLKGKDRKGFVYIALAGVVLAITGLSDWQYLYFSLLFTFLLSLSLLFDKSVKLGRVFALKVALLISVLSILILPFAYPMFAEYLSKDYMKVKSVAEMKSYVSPLNYFIPNAFSFIHTTLLYRLFQDYSIRADESVVSLGYTLILLSILAIRKTYKKVKIWLIFFVFFFLLSLNPVFVVNQHQIISPLHQMLYVLPFFNAIKIMNRAALFVMFSMTIIFSYSLKELLPKNKLLPVIFVLALIFFEFIPYRFPSLHVEIPSGILELESSDIRYSVMNIPSHFGYPMFMQILHKHKMIDGYVARVDPQSLEIIDQLRENVNNSAALTNTIRSVNLKYILIYYEKEPSQLLELLDKIPNKVISRDKGLEVREILID